MTFWDRAKWNGLLYIWSADPDEEPFLALGFEDGDTGRRIFRELIQKLGPKDERDQLRISIITDVSREFSNKYAVIVGRPWPIAKLLSPTWASMYLLPPMR